MSEHALVHELRVLENQMRGLGDREAADVISRAVARLSALDEYVDSLVLSLERFSDA